MSAAVAISQPQILHAIPGRVRVSLPGWSGQGHRSIESGLSDVPGVRLVRANPVTGNVVIQFDPRKGKQESILAAVRALAPDRGANTATTLDTPPAIKERAGERQRDGSSSVTQTWCNGSKSVCRSARARCSCERAP